jgi:hypothetical protein
MYVMDQAPKCKDYLNLVEFYSKNVYQKSLNMIPFESLYGRKCNTPLSWDNPIDQVVIGLELLREMEEKILKINFNLKTEHHRKKRYAKKGKVNREI